MQVTFWCSFTTMDLKEDPKERQQQIDATLGDSSITSQEGVELYDKWSEHYEQVIKTTSGTSNNFKEP